MPKLSKKVKIFIWLIFLVWFFWWLKFANHYPRQITLEAKPDFWGVTYSPKLAVELGLDWGETFIKIIDDLGVKNVRLPIYWDWVEEKKGEYNFFTFDYILDQGKQRNVDFIINIGWRLPRWPECHSPEWLDKNNETVRKAEILKMLETVVLRYKDRPEIVAWQVENEPLFDWFGECPKGDKEFLEEEVALVKRLDSRPIIISASGELSSWRQETKIGDIFGTTMYRVVWNNWFGYFRYPWPTWFYPMKANLVGQPKHQIIISELQAEPWVPHGSLASISNQEIQKSLSIRQLEANMQYAIDTGFNQAYLWGVEYWYAKYQQGDHRYWDFMKNILKNARYD
jgi:hypothetical protein